MLSNFILKTNIRKELIHTNTHAQQIIYILRDFKKFFQDLLLDVEIKKCLDLILLLGDSQQCSFPLGTRDFHEYLNVLLDAR